MSAIDTAYAESAQAIFCAMADYLGEARSTQVLNLKKYPTFEDFEDVKKNQEYLQTALKRVSVDMPVEKIYDYIRRKKDWYKSSVLIANKIVKDLKTIDSDFTIDQRGFNDGKMFYLRGDNDVLVPDYSNPVLSHINMLQLGLETRVIDKALCCCVIHV